METNVQTLAQRLERLRPLTQNTPLLRLGSGGKGAKRTRVDLWAKAEFCNWTGSMKIRPALEMLHEAAVSRTLTTESVVVESSSGNMALALGHLCKAVGLPFIAVTDPCITDFYARRIRSLATEVIQVTEADEAGGFLKTRLKAVHDVVAKIPGAYWPNQYANPANRRSHELGTGEEIASILAHLDEIYLPVSTCGTIAGVSRRLKRKWPGLRVVAVDAFGSVIFGGPPSKRRIPGLGSSIVPPLIQEAEIDEVVLIPEEETIEGCHLLLKEHGIYAGGSSGAVYAAVLRRLADGASRSRETPLSIAFLCPDSGEAYADIVYGKPRLKTDDPRPALTGPASPVP